MSEAETQVDDEEVTGDCRFLRACDCPSCTTPVVMFSNPEVQARATVTREGCVIKIDLPEDICKKCEGAC